ncbi:hypothetical protein R1sor_024041 [Riccia sorocarpa]|uniref:Reverse transcriptase domain-containing protein n=1 Tax=Riccia sorocarpa TaxID=122646 RepID=A0ABD3GSM5_9MARC
MRIKEFLANTRLTTLAEGQNYVIDFTVEGKAGAAVVLKNKNWSILERGVKGDGSAAWMRVQTEMGPIGFVSVHGPRERNRRKDLWKWLEDRWDQGEWFFGGDWNSVETVEDSVGLSPVQQGSERRAWQSLCAHQVLQDGWLNATVRDGPHFTRQQKVGDRLDQARLDRIYFTKCERWVEQTVKVQHDAKVMLSDHRPVVLTFMNGSEHRRRRANYFKTAPELVKSAEIQKQIQDSWKENGIHGEDPRRNWDWKWGAARRVLMKEATKLRQEKTKQFQRLKELEKERIRVAQLKKVLPALVNKQQKGFVSGRSITDNVMAFQVGQEWAKKSRQPTLFVKLDFEKAYYHVSHEYLWETMTAMDFNQHFITLTQGLVCGATSKIYAMGAFTKEFDIQRGVRQRCPLAPLIFALATKPLLLILQQYEREGRIHGLQIKPSKSMLVQLFADDSGVTIRAEEEDFDELHNAIRLYERISGAKLNLQKSTVIPWAQDTIPTWLLGKGCKVARRGELIRYLGFPVGWGISEEDQKAFLLAKLKRRLNFWGYRMLTFQGRCIVLKHILRSIPVYNLACLEFTKKSLMELETIGRVFLWGLNREGQKKIPLIAWQAILSKKNEGGLDLVTFDQLGRAMKMKQSVKLITNPEEEWVMAMAELVKGAQPGNREMRSWTTCEIMLLKPPKKITNVPASNTLLQTWRRARRKLVLRQGNPFPGYWSVEKYLTLATFQGWLSNESLISFKTTLQRLRADTLTEWKRQTSLWLQADTLDRGTRECLEFGNSMTLFRSWNGSTEELCWQWEPGANPYPGWTLPTKIWKCLFKGTEDFSASLNHKWSREDSPRRWKKRLSKIWKSFLPPRDKIWLWKLIQQGVPTAERVAKWRRMTDRCARCNQERETMTHLFVSCLFARRKWRDWEQRCHEPAWTLSCEGDFINAIDSAWNGNHIHKMMLFTKTLWLIWLERNRKAYGGEEVEIHLKVAAFQAVEVLRAMNTFTTASTTRGVQQQQAILDLEAKFNVTGMAERDRAEEETHNPRANDPQQGPTNPLILELHNATIGATRTRDMTQLSPQRNDTSREAGATSTEEQNTEPTSHGHPTTERD